MLADVEVPKILGVVRATSLKLCVGGYVQP